MKVFAKVLLGSGRSIWVVAGDFICKWRFKIAVALPDHVQSTGKSLYVFFNELTFVCEKIGLYKATPAASNDQTEIAKHTRKHCTAYL